MTDRTPKRPRKPAKKVDSIRHAHSRVNNPTAEAEPLVAEEESRPLAVSYARNADLDPQLCWTGKDEENSARLDIDAVPIYVQEKIHPQAIISDLQRAAAEKRAAQPGANLDFFASAFNGIKDDFARVEFYRHKQKWSNRLILGDSLMVMASLAHKEGMKGKVQCIYMDPPYGIKFASNWQTSTKSTSVSDNDETREPEMIQAFRDTWKLGIHSYLSYLRDRLTVARDLLTESGSVFVQISDENVHLVRCLMDEIFGTENFISLITFSKTSPLGSNFLASTSDYIVWYGKNKDCTKYTPLFNPKQVGKDSSYVNVELSNSQRRRMTPEERQDLQLLPKDASVFAHSDLLSTGYTKTCYYDFNYHGKVINRGHYSWKTNQKGMGRLIMANRLFHSTGVRPSYVRKYSDFPVQKLDHLWGDTGGASSRVYVVQTATKVIQRCILMTTDPGDLVLDPTCGSGTTAVVAEQWGRRWITTDTSRVALAIARARLMGGKYDYYLMRDSEAGAQKEQQLSGRPSAKKQFAGDVRHGFVYERVPHITLGDIANNAEIDIIWDKWQETLQPLQQQLSAALGKQLEEWQIPPQADDDWTAEIKQLHSSWLAAKTKRQQEIDASIAANAKTEQLVDRPYTAPGTVRVTGPFTVESLSPHRIVPTGDADEALLAAAAEEAEADGDLPAAPASKQLRPGPQSENESAFLQIVYDNLKSAGIQNTRKGERLEFSEITPWANSSAQQPENCVINFIGHYEENGKAKKAAICVGPEYGTVTRSQMTAAAWAAADSFNIVIMMGFAFEAHADEKLLKIGRMQIMRVRLNNDLHMGDRLKKSAGANLFVVFGEPDIQMRRLDSGDIEVEILGVDIYDPTTGEVKSGGVQDIACWMIDTDYNRESFFARHIYFTGGGKDPYKQLKSALRAEIDEEQWATLTSGKSRPFPPPQTGKIAVKAINHYGDEVIKVFEVE